MIILALTILAIAILFIIFIYDNKMKSRKHRILIALRSLIDGPVTKDSYVLKDKLMEECPMPLAEFLDTLRRLQEEDLISIDNVDKISFTFFGLSYYKKKVVKTYG